jgi:hypothetical protein
LQLVEEQGTKFVCLGCQGKRVRPPSQAAIDAAIAAAAARGGAPAGYKKRARLEVEAVPEEPAEEPWTVAAARVLRRVAQFSYASDFLEPVDLEDVPDYMDVVKQPIDLGTMMAKLAAGAYFAPEEMLVDAAQASLLLFA